MGASSSVVVALASHLNNCLREVRRSIRLSSIVFYSPGITILEGVQAHLRWLEYIKPLIPVLRSLRRDRD